MAATTAATTYTYRWRDFHPVVAPKSCTNNCVNFGPRRGRFCIRSSLEDETTTTTTETEEESQVEVQKGPPSLISALNVEKALRGICMF